MPITLSKTYPKQLKMTFDDYCKPMLFPMKKYMNAVRYLFILFFLKDMDIITFSGKFYLLIIWGKIKIHYLLILFMYFFLLNIHIS